MINIWIEFSQISLDLLSSDEEWVDNLFVNFIYFHHVHEFIEFIIPSSLSTIRSCKLSQWFFHLLGRCLCKDSLQLVRVHMDDLINKLWINFDSWCSHRWSMLWPCESSTWKWDLYLLTSVVEVKSLFLWWHKVIVLIIVHLTGIGWNLREELSSLNLLNHLQLTPSGSFSIDWFNKIKSFWVSISNYCLSDISPWRCLFEVGKWFNPLRIGCV